MKKIRVGILFGGRSSEHEVSLQSARSVTEALDKDKYEVVLIGIDKNGKWYLNNSTQFLLNADNPKLIALNKSNDSITLVPWLQEAAFIGLSDNENKTVDVVFPVLHGSFGEDGTMQGLLKLADVPFVGADVLGSAVGMDKDVMKRLLKEAGLPIAKFIVLKQSSVILSSTENHGPRFREDDKTRGFQDLVNYLGLPFFVKPANAGSSIGVSKVKSEGDFQKAIDDAFQYDGKILIEQYIKGREIECAVLGNDNPRASLPGEIVPMHEFYSYVAKYIDEHGAKFSIPANLDKEIIQKVQKLAIKTFQTLCCYGMARVDFFLTETNELFVNEINTIPGFTKISMYPKLWEASGVPYKTLLDELIRLAIEKHEKDKRKKTTYTP